MSAATTARARAHKERPFSEPHIARCWEDALDVWDVRVDLSPPRPWRGDGKSHWKGDEPLAYIDLETRQVVVNYALLRRLDAADSLTAVLAHEVGHHVRYPHSLGEAAALRVLEQRLLPGLSQSLTNLFYDLLVNEHVGRTRAQELIRVYRGFVAAGDGEISPLFAFYLTIYEELWGEPAGSLVPEAAFTKLEEKYPGTRADARVFVETFYELATVQLKFVYFCCRFLRYVETPSQVRYVIPLASDLPEPGLDDLDEAVRGNPLSEKALEEAAERGWLDDAEAQAEEADPFTTIDRITAHLPGNQQGAFRRALVGRLYKRLVERHLLRLPEDAPRPEPSLPTVLEDWDHGDDPKAIDWTATVLTHGPLAGAHPLRRELEVDEPPAAEGDVPALEIYLDTSGSMPNPERALNTMTLAAQVLSASALRKNGLVRGIVYSSGPPKVSEWMRDEGKAREFLLHYVGGGTDFPFDLLREHVEERPDAIRVIVSDSDFLYNVRPDSAKAALVDAARRSRLVVALLAVSEQAARQALSPALAEERFRLAIVRDLQRFGPAAAALSRALLGD